MSDTYDDLREMFRRRERDVPAPLSTLGPVLRRTRRRQMGTVLVATITAIALVAVPVVGLRFVGHGADRAPTPGGSVPVESPSVVASGTDSEGGAWTLSITHDTMGDGLSFAWGTGGGAGSCCIGPHSLSGPALQLDGMSTGSGKPSVVRAFASTGVVRVVAKFPGGSFDGQLFPFPNKYLGPVQIVVVLVSRGVPVMHGGTLIAYDAAGNELERVPLV